VRSLESSTRHLKVASAGDVNARVVVMEWQTVSMIHAPPEWWVDAGRSQAIPKSFWGCGFFPGQLPRTRHVEAPLAF
jgi:hypothetical protein